MVLSDITLKSYIDSGTIVIEPFDVNLVQPASIDIRLGHSFAVPNYEAIARKGNCLSLREKLPYKKTVLNPKYASCGFVLQPKAFVLATTLERITVPDNLSARVDGRSSIGRFGLFIQNAGWIDPGFSGEITLELFNALDAPILLTPGRRIGQLVFHTLTSPAQHPYNGKYQNQSGATGSMIYEDFELHYQGDTK